MKKITKTIISIIVILILTVNYTMVLAAPPDKPAGEEPSQNGGTPPDKPEGEGPGGESGSSNISHTGATEFSSGETSIKATYSSNTGSQNALLVTDGESSITNPTVTKTGDSEGDNSDFYGTNAAILVKKGTLNISGGNVTTEGSHANAVFAYDNGTINISNTVIKTTGNNSGAIIIDNSRK